MKLFQVLTFIPRKALRVVQNVNKVLEAPVAIEGQWSAFQQWVTKMFGGTTSSGEEFQMQPLHMHAKMVFAVHRLRS